MTAGRASSSLAVGTKYEKQPVFGLFFVVARFVFLRLFSAFHRRYRISSGVVRQRSVGGRANGFLVKFMSICFNIHDLGCLNIESSIAK